MTARSEIRSSDIADLVQVLILFMSEEDRSAPALLVGRLHAMREDDGCLEKHPRHTHQVLVEDRLEVPSLLTTRT